MSFLRERAPDKAGLHQATLEGLQGPFHGYVPEVRSRRILDGEHEKRELLRVLLARLQLAVDDSAEQPRCADARLKPKISMTTQNADIQNTVNEATDKGVGTGGAWFGVGRTITVKAGATRWMKERGFWLDEWPDSIDGMTMQIVADYTHLGVDSAHWWCENETVKDCGIHPDFLSPNAEDQTRSP